MSPHLLTAAFAVAMTSVTGCGQTGALRLPAQAPERERYLIGSNPNAKPKAASLPIEAPGDQPSEPAPVVPAP